MSDEVCENLTVNKISNLLGNVGIGTNNPPQCELDVSATRIKLGLEKNGGGRLWIGCNQDKNVSSSNLRVNFPTWNTYRNYMIQY